MHCNSRCIVVMQCVLVPAFFHSRVCSNRNVAGISSLPNLPEGCYSYVCNQLCVHNHVSVTGIQQSFCYTLRHVRIVYLRQVTGKWAYPFLRSFPPPLVPLFFAASFVVVIVFYYIGKMLAYLRWGG